MALKANWSTGIKNQMWKSNYCNSSCQYLTYKPYPALVVRQTYFLQRCIDLVWIQVVLYMHVHGNKCNKTYWNGDCGHSDVSSSSL